MTDKQIIIDGKECRYWFRPNPDDYRKCSLRGKNDNCDEIKDCFVKELLGKLALKEQECEELKETLIEIKKIAKSEIDSKEFMVVQCMLNGDVDNKNKILEQILQKISECEGVNKQERIKNKTN